MSGETETKKPIHKLRDDGSGKFDTGRPPKPFDHKQFEELCKLQCTKLEICAVLRLTDKTLDNKLRQTYDATFSEAYEVFAAEYKVSLRRAQKKSALENESVTMQKWLGIQLLGQKDRVEEKVIETIIYKTDASDLTDQDLDKELAELEAEEARDNEDQSIVVLIDDLPEPPKDIHDNSDIPGEDD